MTDSARPGGNPMVTDPTTQRALEFLGGLLTIRAGASDTSGQFTLIEHEGSRGYGSPVHVHDQDDETFLVLEGSLRIEVGDATRVGGPGPLALLPGGSRTGSSSRRARHGCSPSTCLPGSTGS